MPDLTASQQQAVVDQWFAENQHLIDAAVLDALERVEGIVSLLTEQDAKGAEQFRQELDACVTAARGTLPEWIRDEFYKKFARSSDQLRETLSAQAELICRDPSHLKLYIDELILRAKWRALQRR